MMSSSNICVFEQLTKNLASYSKEYQNYVTFMGTIHENISGTDLPKVLVEVKQRILRESFIYEKHIIPEICQIINDIEQLFAEFDDHNPSEGYEIILKCHNKIVKLDKELHQIKEQHDKINTNVNAILLKIHEGEVEEKKDLKDVLAKEHQIEEHEQKLQQEYQKLSQQLTNNEIGEDKFDEAVNILEEQYEKDEMKMKQLKAHEEKDHKIIHYIHDELMPNFQGHIEQVQLIHSQIVQIDAQMSTISDNTTSLSAQQKQSTVDSLSKEVKMKMASIMVKVIQGQHKDLINVTKTIQLCFKNTGKQIEALCKRDNITIRAQDLERFGIKNGV